jgi:hypothetical protein
MAARVAALAILLACAPARNPRLDALEAEARCGEKVMEASTRALLAKLDRTAAALESSVRLRTAARELDQAEAAVAAARTPRERRAAWRAWMAARQDLRAAAR